MRRLVAVLLALLVPVAARAYLPPGPAVVKRMAAARAEGQPASLVVRGEVTFWGEDATAVAKALSLEPAEAVRVPAALHYKQPGSCRVEVLRPGGVELSGAGNAGGRVSASGIALASLRVWAERACPLLDPRGGDGAVAWVREQGVDLNKVNLGRFEGTVAYVVGARAKDANVPSLWVDKDRNLPLRLVAREGSAWREVRLLDYGSPAAGPWHPRVVEIRSQGQPQARFTADRAE